MLLRQSFRNRCFILGGLAFVALYIYFTCDDSSDFVALPENHSKIYDEFLFSNCKLALADKSGWTKVMRAMANTSVNPIEGCDRSYKPLTTLGHNGTVWIDSHAKDIDNLKCWARTLSFKTDTTEISTSEWIELNRSASENPFPSDFVHTLCVSVSTNATIDDYTHMQMWNVSDDGGSDSTTGLRTEHEESGERSNMFIFLVDSVSNTQSWRSLPETVAMLQTELDAVNFLHLNKVADNSRGNGFPYFFGKSIISIEKTLFGLESIKEDWDVPTVCDSYLDQESFVLTYFRKRGYKTLYGGDWANHDTFSYPPYECKGFETMPTTHYTKAFFLNYDFSDQKKRYMAQERCLEPHNRMFEYYRKFLKAYPKSPKASIIWMTDIAHDSANNLFHVDKQFVEYFREFKDELEKSYVFFLADHGPRYGYIREADVEDHESRNPMFYVSVPKNLRERINPILKENSVKLVTGFDLHTTFLDIAKDSQHITDSGPQGLRGNSLLRPLPPGERSCRTLPIPLEYCLCDLKTDKINNNKYRAEMGARSLTILNNLLLERNISNSCELFTMKKVLDVHLLGRVGGLHEVTFLVNECHGHFKGIISVKGGGKNSFTSSLVSKSFSRLDSYGSSADCMYDKNHAEFQDICCCRNRETSKYHP